MLGLIPFGDLWGDEPLLSPSGIYFIRAVKIFIFCLKERGSI